MTTNGSQSRIAALFSSSTLAGLLSVLCLDPDREHYQRELARMTGTHLRQLQRDLGRLERAGLVVSRVSGNRTYYRAQRAHPAFDDLRRVIIKTLGLGEVIGRALAALASDIAVAFIFGSFARCQDTVDSDVDLLVIGAASRRALSGAIAAASRELGREINVVILAPGDFVDRRRSGDHFVASVLKESRIWVIGDEEALAALA